MSKIIHLGKYYFPDFGGIESVTRGLARGAVIEGHSAAVVCFGKVRQIEIDVIEGVTVVRVPEILFISSQPIGFRYLFEVLKYSREADVLHVHVPNMLAALSVILVKRLYRPKVLVHWHSDVLNKGVLGWLVRPLERKLCKEADKIIATSSAYAEASISLKDFRDKVDIVPIGIQDVDSSCVEASIDEGVSRKISGRKIVLSVGRLVPYKGFCFLVEAAKQLAEDSVIVIAGAGPLEANLQRQINEAGVANRVLLVGRVSEGQLTAFYQHARVFCMASTYRAEAFGVVLLEAMAYGIPVVATEIPGSGVPWVNQDGVSGFNVPIEDPTAMAKALNSILASDVVHSKLSKGARQRYEAYFTEIASVKRIMELYKEL